MIEDKQHLQVLGAMHQEIYDLMAEFNRQASGVIEKGSLVQIRLVENEALVELLEKHRRALRFMAGLSYEPVAHSAEAVLIGVGDLGT